MKLIHKDVPKTTENSTQNTDLSHTQEFHLLLENIGELRQEIQLLRQEFQEMRKEINSHYKQPFISSGQIELQPEKKDRLKLLQIFFLVIPFIGLIIGFVVIMLIRS